MRGRKVAIGCRHSRRRRRPSIVREEGKEVEEERMEEKRT
jgi:hypothetical protein